MFLWDDNYGSGSVIQDRSDHGTSKELTNLFQSGFISSFDANDPSDIGSKTLIWIIPKEHTLDLVEKLMCIVSSYSNEKLSKNVNLYCLNIFLDKNATCNERLLQETEENHLIIFMVIHHCTKIGSKNVSSPQKKKNKQQEQT